MLKTSIPGYFKARRQSLTSLPEAEGATFVLPAAPEVVRNNDVYYPFRQDSNFYYLTGFDEPEAWLVLAPSSVGGKSHRTILFVRKRDREREMWEGERYGTEGAVSIFGADEAYLETEFESKLPEILKGSNKLFYRTQANEQNDRLIGELLAKHRSLMGRSGRGLLPIHDPSDLLGEMRMFKSNDEAELMRKACSASARAHKHVMQFTRAGMNEREVASELEYYFRKLGCDGLGYGSIVAGGKNATCLHYKTNNEDLRDGDLLLIDAGGERDYYGADITRTFPVGKKFTPAQAKIYDLVLKAQLECIAMAKPGATLPQIHSKACEILTDGMIEYGFLKGNRAELIASAQFRKYYPHGTGHWLGMDVHDAGLYQIRGEPRKLEPGMLFTIEPGFYVQPGDADAPSEFRDIGIRIEDDILITKDGCEILTSEVPKTRADIEALRT